MRREKKENVADFVAKKREMFLVQMSLDVKKAEILKLDEKAKQKEAGAAKKASTAGGNAGVTDARKEMSKTKEQLTIHMGKVHKMVDEVCGVYFQQMRRHVYVTPKSYLSFLAAYNELYTKKYNIIDVDEGNILSGLEKLAKAGADVEVLKADLAKKGVVLKTKTEETDRLLKTLDVENKRADVKAKEVNEIGRAHV